MKKHLPLSLKKEEIKFVEQKIVKVIYEGIELGDQRVDFLVEGEVIVELKSVSEISEIHEAQLLSYLKTTDKRVGLILNFAKKKLDIKRLVNKY